MRLGSTIFSTWSLVESPNYITKERVKFAHVLSVYECVPVCEGQRMTLSVILKNDVHFLWKGLSLPWSSWIKPGCLVSKPQRTSCLCLLALGLQSCIVYHLAFVHRFWRSTSDPHSFRANMSLMKCPGFRCLTFCIVLCCKGMLESCLVFGGKEIWLHLFMNFPLCKKEIQVWMQG